MIQTETAKQYYSCNGSQTSFPITFPFDEESEIHAWIRNDATTEEDKLINPDDFSVSGSNLITVITWASGYTLVIKRLLLLKQETEYIPGDPLPAKRMEYDFDDVVKMVQQLQEKMARAVLLPETTTFKDLILPEPNDQHYLKWIGNVLKNVTHLSNTYTLQEFMKTFIESLTLEKAQENLGLDDFVDEIELGTIDLWHKSLQAKVGTKLDGDGVKTADSDQFCHLKDADGVDWTTIISAGDVVYNADDGLFASVVDVTAHDLTLDRDAFPDGNEVYYIYDEPLLSTNNAWVECKGQTLNDAESPFNGQIMPDLMDEQPYDSVLSSTTELDTTYREFGTSYGDGKIWQKRTYRAKTKLLVHLSIPSRNDSSAWGGGYLDFQYSLNGGAYVSLGSSGFDMNMCNSTIHTIDHDDWHFLLDLDQSAAYTLQFKCRHKSYDGTLQVNNNRGQSGELGCSKLIIIELAEKSESGKEIYVPIIKVKTLAKVAKGPKGDVGPAGSLENLPIGIVFFYKGTGIADPDTRIEEIGKREGDTVSLTDFWVCNGQAGTPDMRNRFVRMESASGNTGGDDDGIAAHTHSINHDHGSFTSGGSGTLYTGYTNPAHAHTIQYYGGSSGGAYAGGYQHDGNSNPIYTTHINHRHSIGSHTHSINPPNYTGTSGSTGDTGGNRPAFYSLIPVIKMT